MRIFYLPVRLVVAPAGSLMPLSQSSNIALSRQRGATDAGRLAFAQLVMITQVSFMISESRQ
jgi:hypothetical protein